MSIRQVFDRESQTESAQTRLAQDKKNQLLKNWEGILAVIGIDWGDSGKGRLVDDLANRADIVARYSGGSNTGHTVENEFGSFKLHIVPSGIFNKNAKCLVGRNVAVNLESLTKELEELRRKKIDFNNLVIDENATLTMPWHVLRDNLREKLRKTEIGTTKNGVGPTYADRTERVGFLVKDLLSEDFKENLTQEVEIQNKFFNLKLKAGLIFRTYQKYLEVAKPFVGKTIPTVKDGLKKGKNILFEGAQGWLLDIDSGTYPFVTSSNPGVVGIAKSYDIHPSKISNVIGITKAYTTRVGEGPMPTKIKGSLANDLITRGQEIGTTTGRIRDPGWLDLVLIKEAIEANNVNALAITKLDVLSGFKKIKIATSYKYKKNGKIVDFVSLDSESIEQYEPVYLELPGWQEDIRSVRSFNSLPKNAQKFIKIIEEKIKIPVKFISVGPKRGEVIWVN